MSSTLDTQTAIGDSSLAGQVLDSPRVGVRLSWVSLFASTSTWICCALPILLVTMGAGGTLAGMTKLFPFLTTLGAHTDWMFVISGIALAAAAGLAWRSGQRCPADPVLAQQCQRLQRWNKGILWISAIVWLIGSIAAFLALHVRMYLDQ